MNRHGKVTMSVVLLAAFLYFELMVLGTEWVVTWHFHAACAIACATCAFVIWRL